MLHINKLLLNNLDPEQLFEAISSALWERTHHHYMTLATLESSGGTDRLRSLDIPLSRGQFKIGDQIPELIEWIFEKQDVQEIEILGPDRIETFPHPEIARILKQEHIQSICMIPLFSRGKRIGGMSLGSQKEHHFEGAILRLLELVAGQIALALDNALAFQDIRHSRDKLVEEKLYLEEERAQDFSTQEMVGASPSFAKVLQQIETVAPSDATVLLLGETGTGKELLARAIHERSRRKARTFVKLNCSAIPLGLVESELFGHERGAFTGAIARKVGRFELAHLGSLFLDEIGDLPMELQPKLLRAIQEREFERLGSTRTLHVDVRLIAATHQNLAQMVEDGSFRRDLFYRLNVFPVRVPALRERKEDIPNLVRYFTQKFARAMDKRIERIPGEAMEFLVRWPWPGNIRELQNLVERSVILSPGPDLHVPMSEMALPAEPPSPSAAARTFEDLERQGILDALKASGGAVGGPQGAAARLGLKRTTLHSKMKRLGLDRNK
ncbi:MAG: sigma 54-interacting transcriptional regulator [Acidobacteria bacterium]|nr:sigma 54-interacting transcriptional regulator [Acidobacteriota bacterium]MBI3489408.1 sigma 54-interacting transcriptional regulator [Acidobacteriota bacterium]